MIGRSVFLLSRWQMSYSALRINGCIIKKYNYVLYSYGAVGLSPRVYRYTRCAARLNLAAPGQKIALTNRSNCARLSASTELS